jgi:hypothetical protein
MGSNYSTKLAILERSPGRPRSLIIDKWYVDDIFKIFINWQTSATTIPFLDVEIIRNPTIRSSRTFTYLTRDSIDYRNFAPLFAESKKQNKYRTRHQGDCTKSAGSTLHGASAWWEWSKAFSRDLAMCTRAWP